MLNMERPRLPQWKGSFSRKIITQAALAKKLKMKIRHTIQPTAEKPEMSASTLQKLVNG